MADIPRAKRQVHSWARWLHVYTSMIALLLVLFFGISGITLNHPTWTLGDEATTTTESGTLPFEVEQDGAVDYLAIAEYVRKEHGVAGTVADYQANESTGSISFTGPGYESDVTFDVADATYTVSTTAQGWVGVMNDLHKGRDTNGAWKWVIDVSAGLLVLISVTGLVMQFFLTKRRRSALTLAFVGTVASFVLIYATLA